MARSVRRITRELLIQELLPAAQSRLPGEPIQLWGEVIELRRFAPQVRLRDKRIGGWGIWVNLPQFVVDKLEKGDMVGIDGTLSLEPNRSDCALALQLNGQTIEWARGLKSRRFNLRRQAIDGLASRAATLPQLTGRLRRIAVVSSHGSSGLADFDKLVKERIDHGLKQKVFDVRLSDAHSIADGIARAGRYGADMVVIVRGGGPKSDLEPFNEVVVVEALLGLSVPAMMGVGHSEDRPAAYRFVAYSADTPSHAAAEVVKLFYQSKKRSQAEGVENCDSAVVSLRLPPNDAVAQTNVRQAIAKRSLGKKAQARLRGIVVGVSRFLRALMRLLLWAGFVFGIFAAGWKGAPYWDKLLRSSASVSEASVGKSDPVMRRGGTATPLTQQRPGRDQGGANKAAGPTGPNR